MVERLLAIVQASGISFDNGEFIHLLLKLSVLHFSLVYC